MKLTTFITILNTKKHDEDKEQFIKEHIKYEYIPYEQKADMAKRIVDVCYFKKENNDDLEEYTMHIDSVAKYMITCMSIIDLFTDIERTKKDGKMLEEFNVLNSSGVFDILIKNINQRELKEFNMVLQMTCDDVMTNEYEPHAFVNNQVKRIGNLIGSILVPIVKQMDIEKIQDLINDMGNAGSGEI